MTPDMLQSLIWPVVVVLVPLAVAAIKGNLPKWAIPVIVPVVGMGIEGITAFLSGHTPNPMVGVILGMCGLWLREFVDQFKKATSSDVKF